ncbi:enhanced serine sensitivity protein SseB C-terminal domain-containing protein [Nakamurella sp. A5-74]|uniref:Enhanced serine sensitivity protein SseB C-terminal domain-containing protein n=1 Tax=Nakamurella sp. A5-74 TaxID=3158264 RepID=A0AAU8DQ67_9ACTN
MDATSAGSTQEWAQTPTEQLLVRAAGTNDPQDGARFADALMDAELSVPGWKSPEGGFTPMTVRSTTPNGTPASEAVAFTHPDRMTKALRTLAPDTTDLVVLTVPGRELFARVVPTGMTLLINLHNEYGKQFLPAEMSDRLAGREPGERHRVTGAATSVKVGEPAVVPPGLIDRLTAYFDAIGGVTRAHLGWIEYPDGLQAYLLGVVGTASRERVIGGMDAAAGDLGTRVMDVAVVAEGQTTIVDAVPPFYRR